MSMREYLESVAMLIAKTNPRPEYRWNSYEAMVLELGVPMTTKEEAPEYGEYKECYRNAMLLAMDVLNDYEYVEGYALGPKSPLAVHHAWVVDKNGRAFDPTWRDLGGEYLGIVLNKEWAWKSVIERGYYGIISADWMNGNKLLKDGFPEGALKGGENGSSANRG